MRVIDLINFSFQNFKNRKSRIVLTVLGVAVAIGVIIFLVSLGYGLQKTILERITTEDSILTLDVYPPDTAAIKLNNDTVKDLSEIPNIKLVSPQAVVSGQLNMGELTSETSVNVVDNNYFRLAGLEVSDGKSFDDSTQNTIIISPTVADLFGIPANEILGKKLKVNLFIPDPTAPAGSDVPVTKLDQEFEVIGSISSLESTNQIFMRYSDLKDIQFNEYQFIKIQVSNQNQIEDVRSNVIEKGYLVSALSDVVEQANQVFWAIQSVLGIFGIFSLFVAAIGLVNTMTISLLERINEIGIMRAIGASAWDIKKIFLIESTVIGFLGGVVGIIIGYVGGLIFTVGLNILASSLGGQPINIFYTPLWFVFFVVLFSGAVGLLSGVLPARKAGKLNALEALRYK